jgi:hypothetical protein
MQLELAEGRQAYFLVLEGAPSLHPSESSLCAAEGALGVTALERHDAAELRGPLSLRVVAAGEGATAHVLMVEMADDGSSRYQAY